MIVSVVSPAGFQSIPWKNGAGLTTELACDPHRGADRFNWRLSMAPVVADGAFSDFTGVDRTLVLLRGKGVLLTHDNGTHHRLSEPLMQARFDGGWRTDATLLDGPIVDFNVMTRRGVCDARVTTWRHPGQYTVVTDAEWLFCYSDQYPCQVDAPDGSTWSVEAGHLLKVVAPEPAEWSISGEDLLYIEITRSGFSDGRIGICHQV